MFESKNLDDQVWDEIEALLIQSDIGVGLAMKLVAELRDESTRQLPGSLQRNLVGMLRTMLVSRLPPASAPNFERQRLLNMILLVGVNGSGKTTSAARIAKIMKDDDWGVMLVAADTFRAAAGEQLEQWGEYLDIPVISGRPGGDAGAVMFDAIHAAQNRDLNMLIVDTAGRLHTKHNLMEELQKIVRVAARNVHEAPHEIWLVLDGTSGQNALVQAREFHRITKVTGVIITKLDSTSKGGTIFAIAEELNVPVRYLGVGEGIEDFRIFSSQEYVDALIGNQNGGEN
jgi:fused signal recognition particle receptor